MSDDLIERLISNADWIERTSDERHFPAHFLAAANEYEDNAREAAAEIARLTAALAKRDERIADLKRALRDVLATGLNGGNNMRLAFIAAGGKALSDDLLAKAEASERAVDAARRALAGSD